MKSLTTVILLLLLALPAWSQSFSEGDIFTLHVVKVRLKPGVTPEEFTVFMKEEFLPAWEKHYAGIETVFLYARRGEEASSFGWINYYDSEEELKSFYPEPGKQSAKAREADKKMKPHEKKMAGYGQLRYSGYTTWEVK